MIVASLLLIAVAIGLLVMGLANASSGLLVGSIGTSLLAAVALVVGARQAAAARAEADFLDHEDGQADSDDEKPGDRRGAVGRTDTVTVEGKVPLARENRPDHPERVFARAAIPVQAVDSMPEADDDDPPDEPASQRVTPADEARVARMATEVLVIDGRPRYHVADCVHLLGRPHEPLPVGEAIDLGFSPCGLCEPVSALLADARHR